MKRQRIKLIIEDNNGLLEGYVEGVKSDSLISASGRNETELTDNIRMLIKDYQQHEGANDKAWQKIDTDTVLFDVRYNISAFFTAHNYLKATSIAQRAHINTQLMNQYITGRKHPGPKQVQKIETAVRTIGKELSEVQFA